MKGIKEAAIAAALVVGIRAQPHHHQHQHHHNKKHVHAPVEVDFEKRDVTWVTPTQVAYVDENGQPIDAVQAVEGIADGLYVILGETTPTFTPPPEPSSTSTSTSSTEAAQFYEQKSTSAPAAATAAATPSGSGLDAAFPSGQIPCANGVPTSYGPILLDQLSLDGWAGFQQPSNGYTIGVAIETIVAPISGGCTPGSFCSYACPPGYEKSQWPPTSQGASGQSVGGLWCNSGGFLELTRPDVPQLCTPGAGGVFIQNNLPGSAAVCRTDYPGSEAMVIPLNTLAGGNYPLTNTPSADYYVWENKSTTAQYYINNLNVDVNDACVWNSPGYPSSAGNWAPMNIGVGQNSEGITYISIFLNQPTSTATLDFDIEITGQISGACSYKGGVFTGGTASGCTTAVYQGNTATIVFSTS